MGARPRPRAQARSSGSVRYGPGGPVLQEPGVGEPVEELFGLGLTEPERGRGLLGPA
ncbi:hypothetical protein GA0115236_10671, partial [Streptomyces sp. IgraMP-1]